MDAGPRKQEDGAVRAAKEYEADIVRGSLTEYLNQMASEGWELEQVSFSGGQTLAVMSRPKGRKALRESEKGDRTDD